MENIILNPDKTKTIKILSGVDIVSRHLDFEFLKLMGYVFCFQIVDGFLTTRVFSSKTLFSIAYKRCKWITIGYFIIKYGYIAFQKLLILAKEIKSNE